MKKKHKISFLLFLFILVISFSFYGSNTDYYTSTQVDHFLAINQALSGGGLFWLNITALGDALLLFPLISFLILTNTRAWAALMGAIPLSATLSHIGKSYFSITRPAGIIDTDKFTVIGETLRAATSLPSGHTITIFAAVSSMIVINLYSNKKIKYPFGWALVLLFLASVVAISRVAVGAHWPADLLLGAIFGILGGFSGAILTFKYSAWWNWMSKPKSKYVHALILIALSLSMIERYHQLTVAWISIAVASLVTLKLLITKEKNELHS